MIIISGVNFLLVGLTEYVFSNSLLDDVIFFVSLPEIVLIFYSLFLVIYILREKINTKYIIVPIVYFLGNLIYIFYSAITIYEVGLLYQIGNIWVFLNYLFVIGYSIYLFRSKIDDASHLVIPHKKINPWLIVLIITVILSVPMVFYILSYFGLADNSTAKNELVAEQNIQDEVQTIEWRNFSSKLGNFKAEYPSDVLHDSYNFLIRSSDTIMNGNIYYSRIDNDENIFYIIFLKYPEDKEMPESDVVMQDMIDSMSQEPNQTIIFSNFGQFKDFRSMDFSLRVYQSTEQGQFFVDGKTIYAIGVVSETGNYDKDMLDRFKQSFEILKTSE